MVKLNKEDILLALNNSLCLSLYESLPSNKNIPILETRVVIDHARLAKDGILDMEFFHDDNSSSKLNIGIDGITNPTFDKDQLAFEFKGERYWINLFYGFPLSDVPSNESSISVNSILFDAIDHGSGMVLLDQQYLAEAALDLESQEEEDNSIVLNYVDEDGNSLELTFVDRDIADLEIEKNAALIFQSDEVYYAIEPLMMMTEDNFLKLKAEQEHQSLGSVIHDANEKTTSMEF